MPKLVYEVLAEVLKAKSNKEKVQILRQNESAALRDVLRGSIDKTITWLLPTGSPPPYTPCEEHNTPSSLLRENKMLTYFAKGGKGNNLTNLKREKLFIGVLESIDPNDALLLIDVINKKVPAGVTRKIVNEAFPGLLKD